MFVVIAANVDALHFCRDSEGFPRFHNDTRAFEDSSGALFDFKVFTVRTKVTQRSFYVAFGHMSEKVCYVYSTCPKTQAGKPPPKKLKVLWGFIRFVRFY